MRRGLMVLALAVLCGCTTVQIPNYIKADHPYVRKIYGDYDKITAAVRNVVVHNGFKIESEGQPSVYERAQDGAKETTKDILFFTDVKQHSMFLYSSYTHLNIYIHPVSDGAQVEIRYGKVTPILIKQFRSTSNPKLAKRLLDQIEQSVQK